MDELAEWLAVHILHGEVQEAFILAHVIDGDDVGVIQFGSVDRLVFEALNEDGVMAEVLREDFESHGALQFRVKGLIHGRHAAPAYLFENLVSTETPANLHRPLSSRQGRSAPFRAFSTAQLGKA